MHKALATKLPDSYMHVHDQSVIETRQRKATTPEDSSFLGGEKRAGSGGPEPTTSCIPYTCTCLCVRYAACVCYMFIFPSFLSSSFCLFINFK